MTPDFQDEFRKRRARIEKLYGPVFPKKKKFSVLKNGQPIVFNVSYDEAAKIKAQQIRRTMHTDANPSFDIVFAWED